MSRKSTNWVRRTLLGTACVLALAAVLIAAAVALVNSRFGQTRALNLVNARIPGQIALSALHLSLLRGRVEIVDGAVQDAGGLEVLSFERLFVDVGWRPLLRGVLLLDALELDRPRVWLSTSEDGSLNLVRAFVAPAEEPRPREKVEEGGPWFPLHIAVGSLRIREGAVEFLHGDDSLRASVGGLGLGASADTSRLEADVLLTFDRVTLDTPGLSVHGSEAALAVKVADGVGNLTLDADLLSAPLRLRATAELGEALPRGWLEPVFHARALAYQASVTQEGLELGDLFDGEQGLSGRLALNVAAEGRGVDPEEATARVDLDLSVSGLRRAGDETGVDARVQAEAHLNEGVARLDRLEAGAGGLALSASGSYGLATGIILGGVRLDAPDLAPVLPLAGIPDAEGSLVLRADAAGTVEAAEAAVSLEARGVGFSGVRLGDVSLAAALDSGGTVRVSSLRLANRESIVEGGGSVRLERAEGEDGERGPVQGPMNFRLSLREVRPQDFLAAETASGTLDGEVVLSGTVQAPEAGLRLAARDLHAGSVRLGDLDARAGLSRGTVTVEALEVRNGASRLSVTGRAHVLEPEGFGLLDDPVLDVSLEGDPIALEDFSAALEGNVSLSARLEGSPRAPLGRLSLNGRDLTAGGQKIHSVDLEARAEGDRIVLEGLQVALAPGESVTVTGWVSLEKDYGVMLRSDGVSLGNLSWIQETDQVQGRVTLELSGEGSFERPNLEGTIRLADVRVRGQPLEDGALRVDVREGTARVAGDLGFPLEGRYDLVTGDFLASLVFPDVDLAPYLALAGRAEMSGRLDGRVELEGNAARPMETRGSLDLSRVELAAGDTPLARGEGLRAEVRDGGFTIPSCDLAVLEMGRLSVSGGGRLEGPMALRVQGELPLQVLTLFTDEVPDIRGRLGLDARVAGSLARPEVHADVEIAGVSFTVPELHQSLHGLNGRVRLSPEALELEGLEGMLDTGTFRMEGRADLDGFEITRVDAALKADRLPLEVPDTLDTRIDLDLRLEGTRAASSVRGRLLLLDGVYYRDVNLSYVRLAREATRRRRAVAPPPKEIANPFLRNMKLDILVQRRAPFRVENDLAELAVEPDLRIIGAVNNPVVTGSARVASGSVTFQKHAFQVTRGTIDFLNPHRTEPTIDIRSQGRIKTWTVYLELKGTPDELELVLSSDPPEEQGDIVSLLLFGRTMRQLIEGEGGSTLSTRQQLAELIGATYGEDIRRATGLDYFELAAVDDGDAASEAIRVTMGRDITRRLRVLSSVDVGDGELVTRVASEYKLLEHFLVGAFQDTRGRYGGEFIFRLEFR